MQSLTQTNKKVHAMQELLQTFMPATMRNMQQELMDFKHLVLTQLIGIKQMLTTLTDVMLPQRPRETTPTGTGATVMASTTGEDSPNALVPARAALTEAPAPAEQETHDHPVLPDAQDGGCVIVQ